MRQADIDSAALGAEVLVEGPFAASTMFWRARRGELRCSILAKTTYALLPRLCPVVDPSDPLQVEDAHWDGAPERSVRTPSDLVPFKHAPEVILVGHAYAPGRRPQKRLGVRLVVGDLDAAMEVFPPRRFGADGSLEEPSAARMPLAYELAAGGADSDNPVGVDTGDADAWGRRAAPSVLPLAAQCEHPGDVVATAGWGPIAPDWPSRLRRLRAEDRDWLADPAAAAMPMAFDVRFFQSAPHTHWLSGPIRADERLVLENLSPAYERLVTNLEGVVPFATMLGAKELRVPLVADTLFIDTDRAVVTLTWRGLVMVDARSPHIVLAIARATGRISGPPPPPIPSAPPSPGWPRPRFTAPSEPPPAQRFGSAPVAAPPSEIDPESSPDGPITSPSSPPVEAPEKASALLDAAAPPREPSAMVDNRGTPPREPSAERLFTLLNEPSATGEARPSRVEARPATVPQGPSPEGPARTEARLATPPPEGSPRMEAKRATPAPQGYARTEARLATPPPPEPGARRFALVDLLAHDAALPARLRRTAAFARVLAALAEQSPRARSGAEPPEERDRADVVRVLSFGAPCDLARARELLDEAFDDPAQLDPPLVLIAGTLAPTPDWRRTLFGDARLRADLTLPNDETIPAYIPASAASRLPMLPSFPAVVLAELRPREDAQEPHPEALLVRAVARIVRQR